MIIKGIVFDSALISSELHQRALIRLRADSFRVKIIKGHSYSLEIDDLGLQPHECLIVKTPEKSIKEIISTGAYILEIGEVTYEDVKNRINDICQMTI